MLAKYSRALHLITKGCAVKYRSFLFSGGQQKLVLFPNATSCRFCPLSFYLSQHFFWKSTACPFKAPHQSSSSPASCHKSFSVSSVRSLTCTIGRTFFSSLLLLLAGFAPLFLYTIRYDSTSGDDRNTYKSLVFRGRNRHIYGSKSCQRGDKLIMKAGRKDS